MENELNTAPPSLFFEVSRNKQRELTRQSRRCRTPYYAVHWSTPRKVVCVMCGVYVFSVRGETDRRTVRTDRQKGYLRKKNRVYTQTTSHGWKPQASEGCSTSSE